LIECIRSVVIAGWERQAVGGFFPIADGVVAVGAVGGADTAVGAYDLAVTVITPAPERRAGEGRSIRGDRSALANGIHDVSVAGTGVGASIVFDDRQDIASGFIDALGLQGGVGAARALGERVGHEILLASGGGADARIGRGGLIYSLSVPLNICPFEYCFHTVWRATDKQSRGTGIAPSGDLPKSLPWIA